ncbi:MAG: hypothetical protein JSS72_09990 [Armatimonadetes bacterium]|nr:hypothetical protein [Armatimonadota bacterium]
MQWGANEVDYYKSPANKLLWIGKYSNAAAIREVLELPDESSPVYPSRSWGRKECSFPFAKLDPQPVYEHDYYEDGKVIYVYAEFSTEAERDIATIADAGINPYGR